PVGRPRICVEQEVSSSFVPLLGYALVGGVPMRIKLSPSEDDARWLKRTDRTIAPSNQPASSRFCIADADFNRWFLFVPLCALCDFVAEVSNGSKDSATPESRSA